MEGPCRSVSRQAVDRHDGCGSCVSTILIIPQGSAHIESPLLGDLMLQPSRNSLKSHLIEEIGWSYRKSGLSSDCHWKVIRGFPRHAASLNTPFSWIVRKFELCIQGCNRCVTTILAFYWMFSSSSALQLRGNTGP